MTEVTAACRNPRCHSAGGIATRLCSFTCCLGCEAEAGRQAGLGVFDTSRQPLTPRARRLGLWQDAAAEQTRQTEAAAGLKGSRQAQSRRAGGSCGSAAAPALGGGRLYHIQGGVNKGCGVDRDLGENRHDSCNTAGDLCSSFFPSSTSVASEMTVQLLCSEVVEVPFSPRSCSGSPRRVSP